MDFSVSFEANILACDRVGPSSKIDLLMLHGAGTGNRARYLPLRTVLAQYGITSSALDFIGHGETGGNLAESSLEKRTDQAYFVLTALPSKQPLWVLGASMGAYNAIKLIERVSIDYLILIAPGVYTTKAYSVPFGESFSKIIRQDRSWADSDAWQILSEYTGNLLLVVPENDTVIPKEIPKSIITSAKQARRKEIFEVPNAPHALAAHLSEHPGKLELVANKILECIPRITTACN